MEKIDFFGKVLNYTRSHPIWVETTAIPDPARDGENSLDQEKLLEETYRPDSSTEDGRQEKYPPDSAEEWSESFYLVFPIETGTIWVPGVGGSRSHGNGWYYKPVPVGIC